MRQQRALLPPCAKEILAGVMGSRVVDLAALVVAVVTRLTQVRLNGRGLNV
jgi:hypothetical protein